MGFGNWPSIYKVRQWDGNTTNAGPTLFIDNGLVFYISRPNGKTTKIELQSGYLRNSSYFRVFKVS